jgi:hypothetical protein
MLNEGLRKGGHRISGVLGCGALWRIPETVQDAFGDASSVFNPLKEHIRADEVTLMRFVLRPLGWTSTPTHARRLRRIPGSSQSEAFRLAIGTQTLHPRDLAAQPSRCPQKMIAAV